MTPNLSDSNGGVAYTHVEQEFWVKYVRGRPTPPQSFWECIAGFHKSHGNASFGCVNDLGAGPGVHAVKLARWFDKVILTDPSQTNLDAAKQYLSTTGLGFNSELFEYRLGKAEDRSVSNDGRFDMVFMANALHWTEHEEALSAIARSLKPGGTFVAALFAMPSFHNQRVNQNIAKLTDHSAKILVDMGMFPTFRYFTTMYQTGYDLVNLDRDVWSYIQRRRLNWPIDEYHRGKDFPTLAVAPLEYSRDSHDDFSNEKDEDWYFTMDLQGLKDAVATIPTPNDPEFTATVWRKIEEEFDGKMLAGYYRVAMIMAVKA